MDPILCKLNEEIQRISQKLDIDMFLSKTDRTILEEKLNILANHKILAETALNARNPQSSDDEPVP